MEAPRMDRVYMTYLEVPPRIRGEDYVQFLRENVPPLVGRLRAEGLIGWYSFLLHNEKHVNAPKPGLYIDLKVELALGRSECELRTAMPAKWACLQHPPEGPVDNNIARDLLRNDSDAEGWRVLGEASEWILRMFDAHKPEVRVPSRHISQFLHYFANALEHEALRKPRCQHCA